MIVRAAGLTTFCAALAVAQSTSERARHAFLRNQMDSAASLFASAILESPRDASLHAYLAEAQLRAGRTAEAAVAIDEALRLDSCNAHAYWVRASLFMPRFAAPGLANDDSTWTNLNRSISCDPGDGNTWTDVWKYAIMRRDTAMEARALRAFVSSGLLTAPQLAYAEWLLRSLPPRAVLLTGGDLDTYAPLAVQAVRRVRPDVAVVNVVMLSATWYSRPILNRYQLQYDARANTDTAVRGAQRIVTWLRRESVSGVLGRPVVFGLATPRDTISPREVLQLAGPYFIVMPPGSARTDSNRITASLKAADKFDWRGPPTSPADRSPVRRSHEPHPALVAARVPVLELGHAPQRVAQDSIRGRERWIASFLSRAGIDRESIDRVLRELHAALPQ